MKFFSVSGMLEKNFFFGRDGTDVEGLKNFPRHHQLLPRKDVINSKRIKKVSVNSIVCMLASRHSQLASQEVKYQFN